MNNDYRRLIIIYYLNFNTSFNIISIILRERGKECRCFFFFFLVVVDFLNFYNDKGSIYHSQGFICTDLKVTRHKNNNVLFLML